MKIEPRYYLSTGLKLLLQNRKRVLVPAVLSSLVTILYSIDNWLPINMQPVGIINNLGYALLIFGLMYLSLLAYAGVLLVAKECLDSESSTLLESYKESAKYAWPIFWYTILFTIITFLVVPLFRWLISIVSYDFAKLCILLAGLLIVLVIFSVFNLVMLSVVIDFQSKKRLRRCIELIKNNFVPVMLIIIISYSFVMIPTFLILLQSLELNRTSIIINDVLYAVVEVFLVPYAAFVQIPLYRELKEQINNVDSNQQPIVNEQI